MIVKLLANCCLSFNTATSVATLILSLEVLLWYKLFALHRARRRETLVASLVKPVRGRSLGFKLEPPSKPA